MYEEQFSKRLTELRTQKGVSARDMSLSIGQNPGYIRAIESGTAFPTMANFFYICEYFNITPQEFFNFGEETSNGMNALVDQLKQFDAEQINALTAFIKTMRLMAMTLYGVGVSTSANTNSTNCTSTNRKLP